MMVLVLVLVLVPVLVTGRQAGLVHQWPEPATATSLAGPVTLSCRSPSPWFFCVWEGPDRSRACGLVTEGGGIEQPHMCGGSDRLRIRGNRSECILQLSAARLADHGSWTCSLSQDKSLDTVKAHRQLEVGVEGSVALSPEEVLVLGEGDLAELECKVAASFPQPVLSWTADREVWGVLDTSSRVYVESEPGSHLVSSAQRVSYVADRRDDGLNITCASSQTGRGGLQYSSQRTVRLTVLPVTALHSRLADRVGVLTVIFITVLVIILALVIVTMLVLKRRRQPKDPRPQPEGVDLLKHVYTIQEKEKQQEYLMKANETYEPLNVSFVDLYQTAGTQSFDSHNKSSSSGGASSASSLAGPHSMDSGATAVEVEPDRSSHRCSTYQETHFDSAPPPPAAPCPPGGPATCPLHPHHTLHILREGRGPSPGRLLAASASAVHLHHTLPHQAQGTATLPHHHPTLFECQHRCFQHPPELGGSE